MEEVSLPVKGSGTRSCGCLYVRNFLPATGSGDATLWIGDMDDASTHREDSGLTTTPGDMPTDGVVAKTVGGKDLALTSTGNLNGRVGLVGGGNIHHLLSEHCHTVHREHIHYESVSGSIAAS